MIALIAGHIAVAFFVIVIGSLGVAGKIPGSSRAVNAYLLLALLVFLAAAAGIASALKALAG